MECCWNNLKESSFATGIVITVSSQVSAIVLDVSSMKGRADYY